MTASTNSQLRSLDSQLTEVEEEERLAAEKAEEERIALEKAEEERVAAEKVVQEEAAQEEAERKEAQEAAAAQEEKQRAAVASQPKESAPVAPAQTDDVANVVYIAPDSGSKYHYSANCRGLSNANSVQEMSLSQAQGAGYELCGWED